MYTHTLKPFINPSVYKKVCGWEREGSFFSGIHPQQQKAFASEGQKGTCDSPAGGARATGPAVCSECDTRQPLVSLPVSEPGGVTLRIQQPAAGCTDLWAVGLGWPRLAVLVACALHCGACHLSRLVSARVRDPDTSTGIMAKLIICTHFYFYFFLLVFCCAGWRC